VSILAFPDAGGGDWLGELVGPRAARVLTTYAVPCLHYAHWQALWRYRLADWTNETTYGTDRYHCLCETFGRMVEQRLPRAQVHLPKDRLGTPFTVATGQWLVYPWRYGRTRGDKDQGLRFTDETGIRSKILGGGPPGQQMLEYEGLPPVPLSNVVFLAWAGNRHEGLIRAFLASPYLCDGLLYWREGKSIELDVEAGRRPYGLPPTPDVPSAGGPGLPLSAEQDVPPPPDFDIRLIDSQAGVDFDEYAESDGEITGTDG
jgi:hypothetical protein